VTPSCSAAIVSLMHTRSVLVLGWCSSGSTARCRSIASIRASRWPPAARRRRSGCSSSSPGPAHPTARRAHVHEHATRTPITITSPSTTRSSFLVGSGLPSKRMVTTTRTSTAMTSTATTRAEPAPPRGSEFGHSHGPGHWHTHELPPDVRVLAPGIVMLATSVALVPSPSACWCSCPAFSLGRVALVCPDRDVLAGTGGTLTAIGLSLVFGGARRAALGPVARGAARGGSRRDGPPGPRLAAKASSQADPKVGRCPPPSLIARRRRRPRRQRRLQPVRQRARLPLRGDPTRVGYLWNGAPTLVLTTSGWKDGKTASTPTHHGTTATRDPRSRHKAAHPNTRIGTRTSPQTRGWACRSSVSSSPAVPDGHP